MLNFFADFLQLKRRFENMWFKYRWLVHENCPSQVTELHRLCTWTSWSSASLYFPRLCAWTSQSCGPELLKLVQLNCLKSRTMVEFSKLLVSALYIPEVPPTCIFLVSAAELPTLAFLNFLRYYTWTALSRVPWLSFLNCLVSTPEQPPLATTWTSIVRALQLPGYPCKHTNRHSAPKLLGYSFISTWTILGSAPELLGYFSCKHLIAYELLCSIPVLGNISCTAWSRLAVPPVVNT
jgi:hypothetical protein